MKQAKIFVDGEGDAMYERTGGKPERTPDPVIEAMKELDIKPTSVLELGCGSGWRLKEIQKEFNPKRVFGYDTSKKAAESCPGMIWHGDVASMLPMIGEAKYDLVIFGFCLYLIDRKDLFFIAAHTDRILQDGGYIIIIDFYHEEDDEPYSVPYKHHSDIRSYHMNHSQLWTSNPSYTLKAGNFGFYDKVGNRFDSVVHVLKKDTVNAYRERSSV